jgi:hypothetical protein
MRLKCIDDHWKESLKDPDITKNHFYDSTNNNLLVLNHEPMFIIIGDNGIEAERPKYIFQTMSEMQRYNRIQDIKNRKVNKVN